MSILTAREKLERLNNGSLIDATFEECNRLAKEYGLTVHTAKKVKNSRYCIMHGGKELLCNDNLLVMHKFCQDSKNLITLAELQGIKPPVLTVGQFWNVLVCQVVTLKNLPENIRIDIDGGSATYANINKNDIHVSDRKVWVALNHRHTLTLFERKDYEAEDLIAVGLSATAIARQEMAAYIVLSQTLDLANVLEKYK